MMFMKGWQRNLPLPFCLYLKVEGSVDFEVIDEKGYKMRKEYIKPEAEMMKFLEEEEIMDGSVGGPDTVLGIWTEAVDY